MDNLIVGGKSLSDLKVTELKDELGKRSLSKSGNKSQLASRLAEFLLENPEGDEPERLPEAPLEPSRKGSPPKNAAVPPVGDSIIAQYLADRESMLAESLDHKRKVQAAEPKPEAEVSQAEDLSAKGAEEGRAPSGLEEEEPTASAGSEPGSEPSRRKGRKPEQRQSVVNQSINQAAPSKETKEDLGSQADRHSDSQTDRHPMVDSQTSAALSENPHLAPSQFTVEGATKSNSGMVSRGRGQTPNGGRGQTSSGGRGQGTSSNVSDDSAQREESWTAEINDLKPAPETVFVENEKNEKTEKEKKSDFSPIKSTNQSPTLMATSAGQTETSVREGNRDGGGGGGAEEGGASRGEGPTERVERTERSERKTRSGMKSPSPLKENVGKLPVFSSTSSSVSSSVSSGVTEAVEEKKADEKQPQLPRKLTESLSVEEEKLDYGEIEPEEDVSMKEEAAIPRPASPRGQKRRQSVNSATPGGATNDKVATTGATGDKVATTSATNDKVATTGGATSDKMADVLRARSEKFGVPLVEIPRETKEPPRKMARSNLTAVVKDESQSTSTSSHGSGSPPPSRNGRSRMIHVKNLVRPYSLPQLKELLRKTGTILDDAEHFWIDGIKSQCIVTYSTEEEAEASRKALFNLVWPSSNPQKLLVDFVREEDFKERTLTATTPVALLPALETRRPLGTTGLSARPPVDRLTRPHIDRPTVEKLKITVASNKETGEAHRDVAIAREEKRAERRAEREKEWAESGGGGEKGLGGQGAEREWDRGKAQLEDTPTKPVGTALELLFQRTETRPQLYWKPLSDDEVKAKEEEEAKNTTAREERRKQVEQDRLQRDRDESKAGFDRSRRDSSRDRRVGGAGGRRDSPRRRSRERPFQERPFRGGDRSSFNRRTSPPYRRRRTPTPPGGKYRTGGRRSRSPSRRH